MDHLVIPLDCSHLRPLAELVDGVAAAAGLPQRPRAVRPHITLVAYSGLAQTYALPVVEGVAAVREPFIVHAHGYGLFTGSDPSDLSLHVPVVRGGQLDVLHRDVCEALMHAGAEVAGWSQPPLWSPHITLLDRELDATRLGNAVAWLASRHHPSWRIAVDRVALAGGWRERGRPEAVVLLRGTAQPAGSSEGAATPEAGTARPPAARRDG